MNAPQSLAAVSPAKVIPGIVLIVGKLQKSVIRDDKRYSVVSMPAADEYSHPQLVEIRSSRASLGQGGDVLTLSCRVGGFALKPFEFTDKKSGEIVKGQKYVMTLDAVE
jgi:hypothetical protein